MLTCHLYYDTIIIQKIPLGGQRLWHEIKFGDLVRTKKYKKLFGILAICLVAIITGVAVGKIFVDTSVVAQTVSGTYRDYQDSDEDIAALVTRSASAMPSSFNAYQAFEIAQYKLYNSENFYAVMQGLVSPSMGSKQNQVTTWAKQGNTCTVNKLSPGGVIVGIDTNVTIFTKYDIGAGSVSVNSKGEWIARGEKDMRASYNEANSINYTIAEYEEKFGKIPTMAVLYVVSSITCGQGTYSTVKKDDSGNYTFDITITDSHLYAAGIYYAKDVEFSSGALPAWRSLKMTVVMDSNFNFKSIRYQDSYVMSMMSVNATVVDDFTQNFYFNLDNVPEDDAFFIGEVL